MSMNVVTTVLPIGITANCLVSSETKCPADDQNDFRHNFSFRDFGENVCLSGTTFTKLQLKMCLNLGQDGTNEVH